MENTDNGNYSSLKKSRLVGKGTSRGSGKVSSHSFMAIRRCPEAKLKGNYPRFHNEWKYERCAKPFLDMLNP